MDVVSAGVSHLMVNIPEQNQPQASPFLTLSSISSGPVCSKELQDSLILLGHREELRLIIEAVFYMCL